MVTKAVTPEEPAEETNLIRVEGVTRNIIAGAPNAAVRRIVLYAIIALALGAGWLLTSVIGLAALVLLIATDELR